MDGPSLQGKQTGIGVNVELEVGDDVRQVRDCDFSSENSGSSHSNQASAGTKLEDVERAAIWTVGKNGDKGASTRLTAVLV